MSNPRNPYDHEITYDQHVWIPRKFDGVCVDLSHIGDDDRKAFKRVLETTFPETRNITSFCSVPVVCQKLLSKTTLAMRRSALRAVRVQENKKLSIADRIGIGIGIGIGTGAFAARYLENTLLLELGTHKVPGFAEATGLSPTNPPDHIHRMQRPPYYVGDLYSAELLVSTLSAQNFKFKPRSTWLDFGCSSGSLIRVLKAFEPEAHFHGVDPIERSIDWAKNHIPGASFHHSDTSPPLPFDDNHFDGVTAVSIWSHLGEREALAWFAEMYRIVKPGGLLVFTAHGPHSLKYENARQLFPVRRLKAVMEGLTLCQFTFVETWIGADEHGLSAEGYGSVYFTPVWCLQNLSAHWDILSLDLGKNQHRQDVYLLVSKKS